MCARIVSCTSRVLRLCVRCDPFVCVCVVMSCGIRRMWMIGVCMRETAALSRDPDARQTQTE